MYLTVPSLILCMWVYRLGVNLKSNLFLYICLSVHLILYVYRCSPVGQFTVSYRSRSFMNTDFDFDYYRHDSCFHRCFSPELILVSVRPQGHEQSTRSF